MNHGGHYDLPQLKSVHPTVFDQAVKQIESLGFKAEYVILHPHDYRNIDPEGYQRLIDEEQKREKSYRMVKRLKQRT